jgi:hypothetical protein
MSICNYYGIAFTAGDLGEFPRAGDIVYAAVKLHQAALYSSVQSILLNPNQMSKCLRACVRTQCRPY